MTIRMKTPLILLAGLALAPAAFAAEAPPADTITVVDEDATPEDVASTITLPAKASEKAVESSAKGLATANAARAANGNDTAQEAREQGREFGQRVAEQARQENPGAAAREAASEARNDRAAPGRPANPGKP